MAWQSVAMETAAREAVQGPMRDSGPGSSMRRRYIGGLWQIRGLAAAMGWPVICQHPMSKNSYTHQQCVRRPESGTMAECGDGRTAAMGGHPLSQHGPNSPNMGPLATLDF
ncbi:unnamed protein product, partial [Staurois parvus]